MKQRLLAVLALAAIAGSAYAVLPGGAATGPATIRITDFQTLYKRLGRGIGSREIEYARLYNRGPNRHVIGHEVMVCTYIGRTERTCEMTVVLPKGTLVVAGLLRSRLLYELAIVGGTGLYDNARGTLTATLIGISPRQDLLLFRLSG